MARVLGNSLSNLGSHPSIISKIKNVHPKGHTFFMVEVWRSIAYYVARNTSRASNQQAILGLVARRTPSNQRFEWSSHNHTDKKKKSTVRVLFLFGRSVEIRTPGLQYPKLARYQLRYTSLLNYTKRFSQLSAALPVVTRALPSQMDLQVTRQVTATPYSSLHHPLGALGTVPNCATPRKHCTQ